MDEGNAGHDDIDGGGGGEGDMTLTDKFFFSFLILTV